MLIYAIKAIFNIEKVNKRLVKFLFLATTPSLPINLIILPSKRISIVSSIATAPMMLTTPITKRNTNAPRQEKILKIKFQLHKKQKKLR